MLQSIGGQTDERNAWCADLVGDLRFVSDVLVARTGAGLAVLGGVALVQFQRGICVHLNF
jgi:hypothetical protein